MRPDLPVALAWVLLGLDLERAALSKSGAATIMKNTMIDRAKTALVVMDLQIPRIGLVRKTQEILADLSQG